MTINKILKAFIYIGFLLCVFTVDAQFEVQGVIRPRLEFRDGYKKLKADDAKPATFVSQRTRLKFGFENDKLTTGITLFDYRVWGDQEWKKDISSVGVHEAWVELKLSTSSKLKFGRQELKYDNSRLLSSVNWNQIGAAHEAIIYKYRKAGWELDFATAWNQSSELTNGNVYADELSQRYYKNLNILWLSKKIDKTTLSSLTVIDGYQDTTNVETLNYRYTSGLKIDYKSDLFQTIGRAFYQGGTLQYGKTVKAYYFSLDNSYVVSDKIKAFIGFELMSGNDGLDSLNTASNSFSILYGGRHKFNGRMDYFSIPSTTKGAGLINPYAKVECKLAKSTKLVSEYHLFYLENNLVNKGAVVDPFLGQEVDFTFTKKFDEYIYLTVGYSMMFASNSMEVVKGGNHNKFNHWAFVMLNINPYFFKSNE